MVEINPVTLEVVRGFLVSTMLQMRATLMRTAYAPILYENKDFSCGFLTPQGELVAMSEDFSGHVFAMALGLRAVTEKFHGRIFPGDILAVNDPYTGGTHLNDIAFYAPFFADGKLRLFIGVRAHHADVGGATPGSFSGQDTEIYQEGVRIVPVKLIEKGRVNQGLWDVLFANMRLQEEREGDALAMLDTARVGEMRLAELFGKYGAQTVEDYIHALLDSAGRVMHQCISRLSPSEYYYEHYLDNGGLSPEPLPIKVKMTIERETMTFDFTGTAPQVSGPMNCGVPVTQGAVFVIAKSWLDPKSAVNGGTFRPLRFMIPTGSCLAAQLPAPVGGCWDIYRQVQSAVVGVFSQAMPWEPGGENLGAGNHIHIGGYDSLRDKPFILYEYPQGGTPATGDTDGATGCLHYDGGDMPGAYPAESAEQRHPVLIESLQVRVDGEGPGYRRSGFGVTRRVRVLADNSQLSVMTDRAVIPPWGAEGAYPGTVNSVTVIRAGQEFQPSPIPGKVKAFHLKAGDVVLMKATAGGGVGDPLEREVELVLKDLSIGYITAQHACDVYGVVTENGRLSLAKTEELRQQIKSSRRYFSVLESDNDDVDKLGCRLCPLHPDATSQLGVRQGDMVEYVGNSAPPLRAWVNMDGGLPKDQVRLGPIARKILGMGQGDRVWLRPLRTTTAQPLP